MAPKLLPDWMPSLSLIGWPAGSGLAAQLASHWLPNRRLIGCTAGTWQSALTERSGFSLEKISVLRWLSFNMGFSAGLHRWSSVQFIFRTGQMLRAALHGLIMTCKTRTHHKSLFINQTKERSMLLVHTRQPTANVMNLKLGVLLRDSQPDPRLCEKIISSACDRLPNTADRLLSLRSYSSVSVDLKK